MPKLTSPTGKPVALRAIHANAGVHAAYRKALESLVDEMSRSVQYWLRAAWSSNTPTPTLAQDASPIQNLRKAMERLGKKWARRFDEASDDLAAKFADKTVKHTNVAMQAALRDAGFTVQFKMTAHVSEVSRAIIAENVDLIRSIPQQYFTQIQQQVWSAVASGSDLATLTKQLQKRGMITLDRAKLIARDQNAKAHAKIEAVRRQELGITKAVWVHSGGGKEPRPSHVKAGADKLVFDLSEGAYLDGVHTWPGYEINCRCTSKAIIPGWDD